MSSIYSAELAQAIGYIVLEAAVVEDSIGELIVLRTGRANPDPAWWRSGQSLLDALEKVGDPNLQPIADMMRRLLPIRHHVVHALWLENQGGVHMTMLRTKSTKAAPRDPGFDVGTGWSYASMGNLAEDFRDAQRLINAAISQAMGIGP